MDKAFAAEWKQGWEAAENYHRALHRAQGHRALATYLDHLVGTSENDLADHLPRWLNCDSGTVSLEDGSQRDHDPADLITYCVPAAYRPELGNPVMFEQLLHRMCGKNDEVASYVWKALGYSLLGENPEHLIFFLNGPTNSGKTLVLSIVTEVLGALAHESKAELITWVRHGRNARTENSIRGARFVTITETSKLMLVDEGQVKRITGERRIAVDRHYSTDEIPTMVTWTIWVATNKMPSINSMDGAMQERVVVIPCGETIPASERDKRLAEKILAAEKDQILAWLIAGCIEYHRTGLAPPAAVITETARYRSQQSSAGQFVEENCSYVPAGATGHIEMATAWTRYLDWVRATSRQIHLDKGEFFEQMASPPGVIKQDSGGSIRRFYGLVWNGAVLEFPAWMSEGSQPGWTGQS